MVSALETKFNWNGVKCRKTGKPDPNVSVVVPVYNEVESEGSLQATA